jgi:hypothetical protein
MTVAAQSKKRIKVTFPQPMFEQLAADVPTRQRNAFIVAATEEVLRRKLLQLESDSPLHRDMTEILQHREQGDLKLHSHTGAWGE